MNYSNSLKYVNSFEAGESPLYFSPKRVRELCFELGRINVGSRFIVVPSGASGHATAVMLESVIKSAGYRVGRITSDSNYDARTSVFLNGEIAAISDFNKCVGEIKNAVNKKTEVKYLRQEIVFVNCLLLCKLYGCEFVVLEGLSGEEYSLDCVCAPYDLVVVPTVHGSESEDRVKIACDSIRRGVREVVSGNQKNAVYSLISNACMLSGVRLNVTARPTLCISDMTARRVEFSYADRGGYVLKSPSGTLRESAMMVIEGALALRRDGVKMPWGSISEGLRNIGNAGCFDILSISPALIIDCASEPEEISGVIETFEKTVEPLVNVTVCLTDEGAGSLDEMLAAFKGKNVERIIACRSFEGETPENAIFCTSVADAAKEVYEASKSGKTVLCFGSVGFAREIKAEFIKLMGL